MTFHNYNAWLGRIERRCHLEAGLSMHDLSVMDPEALDRIIRDEPPLR